MIKIETQLSRIESILESKVNGTPVTITPQSRIEILLSQLSTGGGGGGNTSGLQTQINQLRSDMNAIDRTLSETMTQLANLAKHAVIDNEEEAVQNEVR